MERRVNDDWVKTLTWDVRRVGDQEPVSTLADLAAVLGVDEAEAAVRLLSEPFGQAAPAALLAEAKAVLGPAAPRKSPVKAGSWVDTPDGPGRVDLVVNSGKVPGAAGAVATKAAPLARVVVDTPQVRRVFAVPLHTLTPVEPPEPWARSADRIGALLADEAAVREVFERGLKAWPGAERAGVTAEAWAQARVEAFLDVLEGKAAPAAYRRDVDLLPKDHPTVLALEADDDEAPPVPVLPLDTLLGDDPPVKRLDRADVEATLRRVLAGP